MGHSAMILVWGMAWLWGVQALPFVDVEAVSKDQKVELKAGKKVSLRTWLLSVDTALNQGQGDGRLTRGEFLLARSLRRWRQLRRWETFRDFAAFVRLSVRVRRCRERRKRGCRPWPRLPKIFPTMRGLTQDKKRRLHYAYSRYARRCRAMASLRTRQPASGRYTATIRRARKRQQQLQALMEFVQQLPRFKRKGQWLRYIETQWRRPAFRKRAKAALGFQPTKRQISLVVRLIRQGKRPGAGDMLRLARMVMQSPLRSVLAPHMLSGWMIWGGDQRSRRKRIREWKAFFRRAPRSCQSPMQRMLRRGFFCGTTLNGAIALLSKSALLNHFVRGLIKPFRATTFDESLKSCVLRRIGAWMSQDFGRRCIPKAQRERLFRAVVRSSLFRYEPYTSARTGAMAAMRQWRPMRSLPCFLAALHPRREPSGSVRGSALFALGTVVRSGRLSFKMRRIVRKFVLHSADASFEPSNHAKAAHLSMSMGDRRVLLHVLKRMYIRPHGCRLMFYGRRKGKRVLWPTYLRIPGSYWHRISAYLSAGPMSRRATDVPRATRKTLYQLVQCGGAPLVYVQRAARFLQPRIEPDARLRLTLWRSLLFRYLHMHRSRVPVARRTRLQRQVWRRVYARMQGKSTRQYLLRLMLVYLAEVGLQRRVERDATVRKYAQQVAAALGHPAGLALLQSRAPKALSSSKQLRAWLLQRLVLWPYASWRITHVNRTVDPKLRLQRWKRSHFGWLSAAQKQALLDFYNRRRQQWSDPRSRRQIERIGSLLQPSSTTSRD